MKVNADFCELCRAKYSLPPEGPSSEDQKTEDLYCDYCSIPGNSRREAVSLYLGTKRAHRTSRTAGLLRVHKTLQGAHDPEEEQRLH